MPARDPRKKDDQLFVRDGRRTYRKQFSLTEFRIGLLALAGLALVALWVVWRGQHPDPELFSIPLESLQGSMQAERTPLPEGLAAPGWVEGQVTRFGWENLYEKINGREGFYKSFGFKELVFVSLALEDDPITSVDIELFDQGTAANALSTYAGERPTEAVVTSDDNGMYHTDRNALYMTRGRYYIRAIGSDETDVVLQQLAHLQHTFVREMSGEEWPWAFELFVKGLQTAPEDVSFQEENAFSFGFARNVWVANWQDFEVFAVPCTDAAAATQLAGSFAAGFLDLGETASPETNAAWVKDRYLGAISGAVSNERWVLGVSGAPDVASAEAALEKLRGAVGTLPEAVLAQAWAQAQEAANRSGRAEPGNEGYEDGSTDEGDAPEGY